MLTRIKVDLGRLKMVLDPYLYVFVCAYISLRLLGVAVQGIDPQADVEIVITWMIHIRLRL